MSYESLMTLSHNITKAGTRTYNFEPQFTSGEFVQEYPYSRGTYKSHVGSATGESGPFSIHYQEWDTPANVGVSMRGYSPFQTWVDDIRGGNGADVIWGGAGDDTILGRGGNDILVGGLGYDHVYGGEGDDLIVGGIDIKLNNAANFLEQWQDILLSYLSMTPEELASKFTITNKTQFMGGDEGNDIIISGNGDDHLGGNTGNDVIYAGGGNDGLWGDNALDTIGGNDTLYGEDGNDSLYGGMGDDVLFGGTGNDTLIGDRTSEADGPLIGNDYLDGGEGADSLFGGDGNDTLVYDSNDIYIDGGEGTDLLLFTGTQGVNINLTDILNNPNKIKNIEIFQGTNYGDTITGDSGNNVLHGGNGDDMLSGGAGNDTLFGDAGNNTLDGGDGNDSMVGGDGNDYLDGGAANDTIQGGPGDDTMLGGAGDDLLVGNGGYDFIDGGAGNDTYLFGTGSGYDHIFEAANGGTDNLYVVGLTDVGIYKQGNHLLIAANNNDVMVLDSWYVNHGVEYIDFEAAQTRYLVSDLANMAVEIQSFGLAEGADMSPAGDVEPITVQGVSALDIPVLA